ncbi:hypothetical protein [Tahibacter harae]|uniref:Uncharacterized protein n=1 Tax=Tahibacter harae TaxID=2963937 RepID=A0ABT1QR02_9GAMM|nr:hypothetical protein [Tahibacter harae]MCQ4164695.1 hypothetical protein [Tahibacter harae]
MRTGERTIEEIRAECDRLGDDDYKEHRRISRLLLLHGIDDAVPQAWIDEGRDFLDSGNREYEPQLKMVLSSSLLMGKTGAQPTNAWLEIERRITSGKRAERWGGAAQALAHGRRSILKWCAWRGGRLRTEVPRKVRERRAKLSKLATKLRAEIKADKRLGWDRMSATIYDKRRTGDQSNYDIVLALDSLIADLAKIVADTAEHDPLQPPIGNHSEPERRARLLERRLCHEFEMVSDGPCSDLVALLVSATLEVDDVDTEGVGARWRAFRSA